MLKKGNRNKIKKTYLDSLDSSDGLLTTYEDKLNTYLDTLSDYDTASEKLDEKYGYSICCLYSLITQMENAFCIFTAINW